MKIGFIGLGRMGRAIAARFLSAGHELTVFNRSPDKTKELSTAGAQVASSAAAACIGREIVVTMLSDDAALEEVTFGDGGIHDALPENAIHLVMGTHGTSAVRAAHERHRRKGQHLVSAPVLGRPDAAAAGQLGVVLAGEKSATDRCRPLIEAIARRVFEAGDKPEHAAVVKLANGLVLGCAIEAMGEAYSLVRKYGVAPDVLYDVMVEGLFSGPAYQGYGKIIAKESYSSVGFTADLGLKDANLMMASAEAVRVPLPSLNTFRDHLLSAIAHGDGGKDWAVMAQQQARAAGLD